MPEIIDSSLYEKADKVIAVPDITDAFDSEKRFKLENINRISSAISIKDRLTLFFNSVFFLDEPTHESEYVHEAFCYGAIAGMAMGFWYKSVDHHRDFIRNYNTAVWENQHLAKRKYLDTFLVQGFGRGLVYSAKLGPLSAATCGLFIMPFLCRDDEYHVSDVALSLGALFGLTRLNLGPRAMGVGALVGLSFGSIAGACIKALFILKGTTPAELRYHNHKEYLARKSN